MSLRWSGLSLILCGLMVSGCQTAITTGETQQAIENDAGQPDAAPTDAAEPDACEPDSAPADAAEPDADEPDAGEVDEGKTLRSTGQVSYCNAGPYNAGYPIRAVFCTCSQLVKDCDDEDCHSCSNTRTETCKKDQWLSWIQIPIVNIIPGCYPEELAACESYCQSNCSSGCS